MLKLVLKLVGVIVAVVAGGRIGNFDRRDDRRMSFVSTILVSLLSYVLLVQRQKYMLVLYPLALLFGYYSIQEYWIYHAEKCLEENPRSIMARVIARSKLGFSKEEMDRLEEGMGCV